MEPPPPPFSATSVVRSPSHYSQIFCPGKRAIHFLFKKNPVDAVTRLLNTANGHILKSRNSRILHNFTPLTQPLVLNLENQSACDMSILSIIVIYLVVKQPIYFTTLLQRKQHFSLFSFLTLTSTWANCRRVSRKLILLIHDKKNGIRPCHYCSYHILTSRVL